MNRILFLLCLLSLFGCDFQNKSVALGPLSQMSEFEVVIIAPSDQDLYRVLDSLKKIGEVSNAECSFTSSSASPSILFFVDTSSKDDFQGSLKVISEISVQPNQFKTSSCIWSKEYKPEPTCYPVDTEKGIIFQKVKHPTEEIDAQVLIDQMVTAFMDQYKHDNPDLVNPRFRIAISL